MTPPPFPLLPTCPLRFGQIPSWQLPSSYFSVTAGAIIGKPILTISKETAFKKWGTKAHIQMVYPHHTYSPTPSPPPPHGTQPCRGPLISLSAQFPADGKLVSIFSLVVGCNFRLKPCVFWSPKPYRCYIIHNSPSIGTFLYVGWGRGFVSMNEVCVANKGINTCVIKYNV